MKRFFAITPIALMSVVSLTACSDTSSGPETADVEEEQDRVYIVDKTGKKWDVTHAQENYGMAASKFQFGLGPNAIQPILNAPMLFPGDRGYPADDEEILVLGANVNGISRAYPINVLFGYEVADEQFGDAHVAVAY
ncbi:MAG: hypothetical protein ACE5G2_05705 [Candidatus Krumholzibacteriia bacterium]